MRRLVCFGLAFVCLAAFLPARGSKEPDPVPQQTVVQVKGRVRLVGSVGFEELVISGDNGQWYVSNEDAPKLKNLQQQTVTVEGVEEIKELKWASGRSAGKRRYLSNIKIVAVE